ncbi:related to galactinol synthase [Rhynchosporium secalis]|uniref:Related to galactinol synthase n=1 Tax=Rhynchosporium secalis TaxID=38038 RepID=A0A1E1M541_RHYSE|nr:related to galactinol synthase [Rhynchosporium secalis]
MAGSKRATESKRVWTTLITNTKYLSGLLTLDYSLKKHSSKYPLVALYTDAFPREGHAVLAACGIPSQKVEYLLPKAGRDYSNEPRFYDCWTKLTPFSLTEYDRVVQLDSDMLVMQNMDELMEMELDGPEMEGKGKRVFAAGHACVCNPLKKVHYPENWVPENCAFTSQHSDFEAAQTTGADPAVGPLGFMNGGLQIVNPSKAVYDQIVAHMNSDAVIDMDFADQSLLSELYEGCWVPLPYIYNALKTLRWDGVHSDIWRDDKVKNVHYILAPKPWEEMDEEGKCTSKDPTHAWWVDTNNERLAWEKRNGIKNDGF